MPETRDFLYAERIVNQLISQRGDALWDYAAIAEYTKLSKQTVQKRIVNAPGFPRAVKLATGGRRWLAREVKAYLIYRREPLPIK